MKAVTSFLLLVAMFSQAAWAESSPTLEDILSFSRGNTPLNEAKLATINESGMRIGAQAGMISRAKEIVARIERRSADLDRIFAFQPLISSDGFLPPVVVQSSQKFETLNSAQRVEFAGVTYKIITPARFVRVAPTWRDYLFAGINDKRLSVDPLPQAIKPSTPEEKSEWEKAVRNGWNVGTKQADQIFMENMNRLKRDYMGMLRYLSMSNAKMIKGPVVSKTAESVKITNDEIAIGVGANEISMPAIMEKDQGAWGVAE
jgi:defect-in-organelle-trafficking protein DotC